MNDDGTVVLVYDTVNAGLAIGAKNFVLAHAQSPVAIDFTACQGCYRTLCQIGIVEKVCHVGLRLKHAAPLNL
jgi:hypothetical protein